MPSEQWRYGVQNLAAHLAGNTDLARLERLLGALEFLEIKLAALGVPALLADYEFLPGDSALRDVQAAIRLATQALERDPAQLPAQLLGRLPETGAAHPVLSGLLAAAAGAGQLVPLTRSLSSGRGGLWQRRHLVRGAQALTLTSNGRQAVCGSRNMVLIWDLTGSRAERSIAGHRERVSAVAVSTDDRWIVAADEKGTLCVWDFESGKLIHRWQGHQGRVDALVCGPEGGRVLSGGADGLVRIWELPGGAELQQLTGHTAAVSGLVVSADGRTAVSSSGDKTLRVWDLSGAAPPRLLGPDETWGPSIALTSQGLLVARAGHRIVVQNLVTGRVIRELESENAESHLSVSADGSRLVAATTSGLEIWDLETGAKRETRRRNFGPGKKALSPDGTLFITAGSNLAVWNLEAEPEPESDVAGISALALTPDGAFAVSSSSTRVLSVWSLPRGQEIRRISGPKATLSALAVTPDGTRLIAGDNEGGLRQWDLASGEPLTDFARYEQYNAVVDLDLTSDGRFLVSGSIWGDVTVWELETGRCVCEHRLSPCYVKCLAVIPGTRRVVVGVNHEDDQSPLVLDLEDGRCLHRLRGHVDAVLSIAVSPDGRTAVTGSQDRSIRVWNLETGDSVWILNGHRGWPFSLAFIAGGHHVVSCADDWTVKVWDIQTGRCLATFTGDRPLHSVAVAPDGRTVVASGLSGDLHVLRWTGQPVAGSPEPA